MQVTRRTMVIGSVGAALSQVSHVVRAQAPERQPPLEYELVNQFVSKSHRDLGIVRELAQREPMLVRASRDGGGGDWETGLGAASHMGRRDIAQFLIDAGARVNVFAVFMLGEMDAAKALLTAFPKIHETPGPHGIPLLSHAIVGREAAFDTFTLLLEYGVDVNQAAWRGATPLMQAVLYEQPDMVRALLDREADPAAKTPKGLTASDLAAKKGRDDLVAMIDKG